MNRVFVDTNAWIALSSKRDTLHEAAVRMNKTLLRSGCRYVTTNFVLDETYTGLRMRVGHAAVIDFGEKIRTTRTVQIAHVSEEIEKEA